MKRDSGDPMRAVQFQCRPRTWARATLGLAVLAVGAALGTQARPAHGAAPADALHVEIIPERVRYQPEAPIRVRLILQNTGDEALEIPLDAPAPAEIVGLPSRVVFGTTERPALQVTPESDNPEQIAPPAGGDGGGATISQLRLAPHAILGSSIDVHALSKTTRYPGSYTLEWRPFDGKYGAASLTFHVETRKLAVLVTDLGKVTFELMYDKAPMNVENFVELADGGFYSGKLMHRVIPGFIAQGGCPKGDGTGVRPDGKFIPAELSDTPVDLGTLLMAHKPSNVNSASCQFFVALARQPALDGQYTVIGQAHDSESLRTLQQIANVPTDRRDRPLSPLAIRSINLIEAGQTQVRKLEVGHPTTAPAPTPRAPVTP